MPHVFPPPCVRVSQLCESLTTPAARAKTWSGAFLHALGWLGADGGAAGAPLLSFVARLRERMQPGGAGLAGYRERLGREPLEAWDAALASRVETARLRGGATAAYVDTFAIPPGVGEAEPGFLPHMPYYFRHPSSFHAHEHARALMRLRCCSTPFAACPSRHGGGPNTCMACTAGPPETAEHALLDCPAYAGLRSDPRFSPLFAAPPAPPARLRAFARTPDQRTLGAFVHAVFTQREEILAA
jgi:hypothetical protein